MFSFGKLIKLSAGFGTAASIVLYFNNDNLNKRVFCATLVDNTYDSSNLNALPQTITKWDYNWDKRDCTRRKDDNSRDDKSRCIRHIILIRHGQYNLSGETDQERCLTELGKSQAILTGKRLKELNLPYTKLVHSTMCRAIETAKLIHAFIPDVPTKDCKLLEEGAPIIPEPPVGHVKSPHHFHQDGPRIEAAFRKFFYRAESKQEYDTYDIIVCHANVIRYFVCRALQYPPEGWLRLSLRHASITWLSILPDGRVLMRCYGDAGFMPPTALTTS
ncbi:serine/threonine-protein phosphatase PGAM5, mitochondrial-like isoform X2 [Rhodnius prolixus]